jgi:hypothetical protein
VWVTLLLATLVGLVCGLACTVRGNNQIIPCMVVVGLVVCGLAMRRRLLLVAMVPLLGAALLCVLPLCRVNQRHHGEFRLTVAPEFPKAVFAWDMGLVDWNQCGTLSFKEFTGIRTALRESGMSSWEVLAAVARTRTVPVPDGASEWQRKDLRAAALVREARARQGALYTLRQFQSVAILLGVPLGEPRYGMSSTYGVFRQLRGKANPNTGTNVDFPLDRLPSDVAELVGRGQRDVAWMEGHAGVRAFGTYFKAWLWVRTFIAAAFIAAMIRLLVTGRWAFATLGIVVVANAVAVPVLTYGCEYRFAAPFFPLMAVVTVYGMLAAPRGWAGVSGRNL